MPNTQYLITLAVFRTNLKFKESRKIKEITLLNIFQTFRLSMDFTYGKRAKVFLIAFLQLLNVKASGNLAAICCKGHILRCAPIHFQ